MSALRKGLLPVVLFAATRAAVAADAAPAAVDDEAQREVVITGRKPRKR
jgi:hypothetical protein